MLIPIAYDTETTGLSRHRGHEMFAFSTCDWDGRTAVYRVDGRPRRNASAGDAPYNLHALWSDAGQRRYAKVMHNARFDVGMTQKRLGRSLRGHDIHETMALSHIFCNNRKSHALDYLGWLLFRIPRDTDALAHLYGNSERGLADVPPDVLDPYQRLDAERTMLLFRLFHPKLKDHGFEEIYEMERRLVWTALDMEDRGVMVDRDACRRMQEWCRAEADRARDDVRAVAGERINPGSDKQVRFLLYHTLGMPVIKRTKKSKEPSVDADTLKALQAKTKHVVFDALLRYAAYSRGVSVLASYLDLSDESGVIHPNINPYQARSSRTSCSRPNLQNVSKSTTLRSAYPIPMRKVFRPRPGFVNVHIDYKGIQARQLVDASGDRNMLSIFVDGDGDVHSAAAECFYGDRFRLAGKRERKSLRDAAKNAVYAIGFGAGLPKVAATLGLTRAEAAPGLRAFRARFPDYAGFNRRLITAVRADGFIKTAFGRRLYVSRDKPYVGANYRIQGDEAGVVKRAANRVDDYLRRATGGEAGVILIIHDELVIEWPRAMLGELAGCLREMREVMIDFPEFKVPMEIDAKVSSTTWENAKEYNFAA